MIAFMLKKILPHFLYNCIAITYKVIQTLIEPLKNLLFKIKLRKVQRNYSKALELVRRKEKIKVAFLIIHEANWKYEGVYKLMEQDKRFEPIVFVCPYTAYSKEVMFKEFNRIFDSFKKQGYNVIKTLDEKTNKWLDLKDAFELDLVFFTNPWNLTKPQYLINNYLDYLTCYVPYGFKNSYLYQAHFNGTMQNFVWRFFLETDIHKKLSNQYAQNKSYNTIVSGYPGMDKLLQKNYKPKDVWKIKDDKIKRIIWAPHHTIPGQGATLDYSNFLEYADFMLEIANKYNNLIQIAFKPHPVLRAKLSKKEVWGMTKTNEYYKKWSELQNGQLQEGEYIDLFLTSDGMIHDSSSFVIEYLYTGKPVMFLFENINIMEKFNEVGKKAFSSLYHGKNSSDIEVFINETILKRNDIKYNDRMKVYNSIVKPPNNVTASENIFNYLQTVIFNSKI